MLHCIPHSVMDVERRKLTCLMMKEQYGQYVKEIGNNETGLGRWTWIKVEGNNKTIYL